MPHNRSLVAINNHSPILKIFTNTLRSVFCVIQAFSSERVQVVQFTQNVLNIAKQCQTYFLDIPFFCFEFILAIET